MADAAAALSAGSMAVIGGGWAGLAAAVRLVTAGHAVTLFEMAPQLGGRARAVSQRGLVLDNGQHILIGAYRATLALMREVGVEPDAVLARLPLTLCDPQGRGLHLLPGSPMLAFARAVARHGGWPARERAALLMAAGGWLWRRFRCDPGLSVAALCAALPARVRRELIDPLCVAALNTPSDEASAEVFLRVLRDALFSGPGAADLLLPRAPLDQLLPAPAAAWLAGRGATICVGTRVHSIQPRATGWAVDGQPFDAVVLACPAGEAARLAGPIAPHWAGQALALRHEPIITVTLDAPGARLVQPMVALDAGPDAPAQFIFDHGALGATPGRFACAVSGAALWVERGLDETGRAVQRQLQRQFAPGAWPAGMTITSVLCDKRATFRCSPRLRRPPASIAKGLAAAGDYIEGPYPATLEGAVQSGESGALAVMQGKISLCKMATSTPQCAA